MRKLLLAALTVLTTAALVFTAERPEDWAWKTPLRPQVPTIQAAGWVKNPIDAFILARLEAAGLKPAAEADRVTLIRRVTFDLIGLPPTPEEVTAFVQDPDPRAYEKLVDRLLASPRHGERWATFWLDLARYAESDGFRADDPRPLAWRYRDYVIKSFNQDKPYDQFIREQLAGDDVAPHDPDALIATGFLRHYPDEFNAVNLEQRRQEILNDITDVTAQVFLGLTLGCARCHDHKFDPIKQEDYYRIQAFFAGWQPAEVAVGGTDEMERFRQDLTRWEEETGELRKKMDALAAPHVKAVTARRRGRFAEEYQALLDVPYSTLTPLQKQLYHLIKSQVTAPEAELVKAMKPDVQKEYKAMAEEMKSKPRPVEAGKAMVFTDVGAETAPVHLLKRGDWRQPKDVVPPGYLWNIEKQVNATIPAANGSTSGRRRVLADWLTRPENPLTARVMVNRLWQHHFGRGIVGSPSDFGIQGELPTHPELLDWLAHHFVSDGWSLKKMHRLMVTSATYRQSSWADETTLEKDSDNKLFSRMNRRRVDGEVVRDALLAISGQLNIKAGGPSIFPELPAEIGGLKGWTVSPEPERHRRSVYVFVKRNLRYPMFKAFDAPEATESCAIRLRSTNAPQALLLLNSKIVVEQARAFAGRVLRDTANDPSRVAERAHQLALGRPPLPEEAAVLTKFLASDTELIRQRLNGKEPVLAPLGGPKDADPAFAAAVVDLCHALVNLNEFIYVD